MLKYALYKTFRVSFELLNKINQTAIVVVFRFRFRLIDSVVSPQWRRAGETQYVVMATSVDRHEL